MQPLLTLAEVAAVLRKSPARVARTRGRLERELGFPAPVMGGDGQGPLLWSPAAVEAWAARRSMPRGRAGRPVRFDNETAAEEAALMDYFAGVSAEVQCGSAPGNSGQPRHAGVVERQTPQANNQREAQVIPLGRS